MDFDVRSPLGVTVQLGFHDPQLIRVFRFSTLVLISKSLLHPISLGALLHLGPILPISVWYSMSALFGIIAPGSSSCLSHLCLISIRLARSIRIELPTAASVLVHADIMMSCVAC